MRTPLEKKPLTKRMEQIVGRLARGMSMEEIGNEIGISRSAVSQYSWRLLQRYGCKWSSDLPGEVEFRSWSA